MLISDSFSTVGCPMDVVDANQDEDGAIAKMKIKMKTFYKFRIDTTQKIPATVTGFQKFSYSCSIFE